MQKADYSYYVDWNNDGDFTDSNEDISSYVLTAEWSCGCESPQPGQTAAGYCRLVLDNSTGIFSSFNDSSPITGSILPGRRVKISMTIGGGSAVQMWGGYLESVLPTVGAVVTVSTAELVAYGAISKLPNSRVNIAMSENITTSAAMALILTDIGIAAGDRRLDTGQSTLSRWWARDADALTLLRELEAAELGLLREDKDGKLAFEARNHRASAPHTTVQATYGAGTLNLWNLQQEDPQRGIYNYVATNIRTFNKSDDVVLAIVSDVRNGLGGTPISVAGSGGTFTVWISFPMPGTPTDYLAVSDWTTVDYEANSAADLTGSDITTDVSAVKTEYGDKLKIVFTNANASTAYLVVLRAHGVAVVESDPIPYVDEDTTSQGKYRKLAFPNPSRWLTSQAAAVGYCDDVLAFYKDPRPRVRFDLKANYDATHLLEAQTRDVSDRIHLTAGTDFGLYLDDDFFIESVRHRVDQGRVHTVSYVASAVTTHTWGVSAPTYMPKVAPQIGSPTEIYTNSIPNGLQIIFGGFARKYNALIYEGEFRAKFMAAGSYDPADQSITVDLRTTGEGGTFAHNGTTQYIVTGLTADWSGCQYDLTSGSQGRWFFAFRLKSRAWRTGWSTWSDGNPTPQYVRDFCDTDEFGVTGPPADWTLTLEAAPQGHAVIVTASRPATNGGRIWGVVFQIKDASTGSWRAIDADTGAADTVYDGSAINHTISLNNTRLTRNSGTGFGTAAVGDLILMDVRGGSFDDFYCQWGTVKAIGSNYIDVQGRFRTAATNNIRIRIVKAPWAWTTEGYLGAQPNAGMDSQWYVVWPNRGDVSSYAFRSEPINIPTSIDLSDIQARVWFDNGYSRSDDDTYSASIPENATTAGYRIHIPDASPIAIDAALSDTMPRKIYFVQLTAAIGNTRELSNMANAKDCQPIAVLFRQDSVGGRSVTLDDKYVLCSNVPDFNLTTGTAYAQDLAGFVYDAIQDAFLVTCLVKNFNTGVGPSASPSASQSPSSSISPSASASASSSASAS